MDQLINQLNEKIKILESDLQQSHTAIVTKDAKITSLEEEMNKPSNVTTELSIVIVIPSSDEIDHHEGKVVKKRNSYYFTLRRKWKHKIRR